MKRILIIDDEPLFCGCIADVLRTKYEMEVVVQRTYTDLERLLTTGFDAVVLDVMMPFDKAYFADMNVLETFPDLMTGKLLFKKIRRNYPKIPIIFHTALREIECDGRSMIINKPNLAISVAKSINDFIDRCENMD